VPVDELGLDEAPIAVTAGRLGHTGIGPIQGQGTLVVAYLRKSGTFAEVAPGLGVSLWHATGATGWSGQITPEFGMIGHCPGTWAPSDRSQHGFSWRVG
jgi:hypothetical protein